MRGFKSTGSNKKSAAEWAYEHQFAADRRFKRM